MSALKLYEVNIAVCDIQASSKKEAIEEAVKWLKKNPFVYGKFDAKKQG